MPAPLPVETRRQIVERREGGETLRTISETMNLSYDTVKKICQHWRKHQKLTPNYEQARQTGTRKYQTVYGVAIDLKRSHPRWGGTLIRIQLQEQFPDLKLPSVRTLQRWFRSEGIVRSPKIQQSRGLRVQRGQKVHQVWAVDAKERMRLVDGSDACWLVVTDEASGAILQAEHFPPETLDTD